MSTDAAMGVRISVLVCTRNRRAALRETLAAISLLEIPPGCTPELVIVDNGSVDGTAEWLRTLTLPNMPVRLVQEPNGGVGSARNAALRAASGDVLLFTDDDARPARNWIAAMCAPILAGEADAVAGAVALAPDLACSWMEPFHRACLAATDRMNTEEPQDVFGASMGFSRRVLEKVPQFDPELGPGTAVGGLEDTLFAWQLKEAGYRIAYVDDTVVRHHPSESRLSRTAYLAAARRIGQARGYLAYHWEHRPHPVVDHRPVPAITSMRVNIAFRVLRLLVLRCVRWRDCLRSVGIARWEFNAVRNLAIVRQYAVESRRPRNYSERGLRRTSQEQLQ